MRRRDFLGVAEVVVVLGRQAALEARLDVELLLEGDAHAAVEALTGHRATKDGARLALRTDNRSRWGGREKNQGSGLI